MAELANLEAQYPHFKQANSPTEAVGATLASQDDTIEHKKPMLSLSNTYNQEEVAAFMKRVHNTLENNSVDYIAELKFDGIAMSLHYKSGKFAYAVTRGDGVRGEDVTAAIERYVTSLPKILNSIPGETLPDHIEVRGEVIIDDENFQKANMLSVGEKKYSTKRNLASGVVNRKKDSTKHTDIELKFIPYGLVIHDEKTPWKIETQWESLRQLELLGFTVSQDALLVEPPRVTEKLLDFLNKWEKERYNLPYDIDGIVIKVNSIPLQEKMGATGKCPRWATAYKFPPNRFRTKLNEVVMQIGRTGKITPVAVFDTVNIDGIQVQRATLHNRNFIVEYGIDVGKTVIIERSGDVIPKVIGVVDETNDLPAPEAQKLKEEREKSLSILSKFDFCPCTSRYPLTSYEGKAATFCTNPTCPAQIEGKIVHFASKHGLDIEGLGQATVRELVDFDALHEMEDIFSLKKWEKAMATIPGWGEKKVSNLLTNIEDRRKNATWGQILAALGIPQVGKELAQQLARDIPNFEALYNLSEEDLTRMDRIGKLKAEAIYKFLHSSENRKTLFVLNEILPSMGGLKKQKTYETERVPDTDVKIENSEYAGKLFVFTGTMSGIEREKAQDYARKLGGDFRTTVSKKVDYLVVGGDGAGESKLAKAQNFGIKIMYETEFKKIIYDYFGR